MEDTSQQVSRKKDEALALFKHGIISPVLYERDEGQNSYFRELSQKEHLIPGIGLRKFSVSTFKSWLAAYRKLGYSGLLPKTRTDKGKSRKVPLDFVEILPPFIDARHFITYSQLYRELISEKLIQPFDFSLNALIKFMRDNNILLRIREIIPRKKFETEHINELWICDFMHSIFIRDGKRRRRTYLCSIIEDHSRIITGKMWSFSESLAELEAVFKSAILTYGVPVRFYCDNARVFRSQAIHLPCAKLGIALIHSKPYDSPSRGKIERFHKTVQSMFLPTIDREKITLAGLNEAFDEWIRNVYHKRIHQGIGEAPLERFMRDLEKVPIKRVPEAILDRVFYRMLMRNVRGDSTVSIDGKLYEAPAKYIGQKVTICHPSSRPSELFICENDEPVARLRQLDIHQNAKPPYVTLSFSELLKKKEE